MIVCDTGPLLAAANADDREHGVCLSTLSDAVGPLIVPALIVTEVCFMLAKSGPQAEATFLRALAAEELTVDRSVRPTTPEWPTWSFSTAPSLLARPTPP